MRRLCYEVLKSILSYLDVPANYHNFSASRIMNASLANSYLQSGIAGTAVALFEAQEIITASQFLQDGRLLAKVAMFSYKNSKPSSV